MSERAASEGSEEEEDGDEDSSVEGEDDEGGVEFGTLQTAKTLS